MERIKKLADEIMDELCSAKEYAEKYLTYKAKGASGSSDKDSFSFALPFHIARSALRCGEITDAKPDALDIRVFHQFIADGGHSIARRYQTVDGHDVRGVDTLVGMAHERELQQHDHGKDRCQR